MKATPSSPLRVGIVGFGVVGKRRRQFIDLHPHLRTVAVCDRFFAGPSAPHLPELRTYSTHEQLLENEDLDILFVCVPNDIAPEATIAGLKRGLHVFCEKPPGRSVNDVRRVIVEANRHPHLKLKYGFNHRYHRSVQDALDLVRTGELGQVINLRGVYGKSKIVPFGANDWRANRDIAGGGILLDQGIHMVDLMRLFAGDFSEIHSCISNSYWKHGVEDNAYALMRADSGVVAMLHSSATQWRHLFQLEVTLARGGIILSGILSGSKSYGAETITTVYATADGNGDPVEKTIRYTDDPSWAGEIADFAEHILSDTPVKDGSPDEALKTMELVFRIYGADPKWVERFGNNFPPSNHE